MGHPAHSPNRYRHSSQHSARHTLHAANWVASMPSGHLWRWVSFACWLASSALGQQSFSLFCIAAVLLGSTNAALQQTRFAAMESVAPEVGPDRRVTDDVWRYSRSHYRPRTGSRRRPSNRSGLSGFLLAGCRYGDTGCILLAFYKPTAVA